MVAGFLTFLFNLSTFNALYAASVPEKKAESASRTKSDINAIVILPHPFHPIFRRQALQVYLQALLFQGNFAYWFFCQFREQWQDEPYSRS